MNHRLPADSDFRATLRRLVVEAENWPCLLSCSSRRLKWKLPGLLLSDAPWVSQQKAKDRGCNLHLQRKKKQNSFARSCSHHTPANIFGICHGRGIQVLQTASALIHSSTPPLAHAPFVPARLLPPRSSLPEGHHPLQAPLDIQGGLSSSCTAPNRSFLKEFVCLYKPGCINAGMVCAIHVPDQSCICIESQIIMLVPWHKHQGRSCSSPNAKRPLCRSTIWGCGLTGRRTALLCYKFCTRRRAKSLRWPETSLGKEILSKINQ